MGTVANSNFGFKGTISSAETPQVLGNGSLYSIVGKDDLEVTAGGAGDRAVTVAAGSAWGDGVLSKWTTGATLNCTANVGTTTRYDTVVIRRTWTPAGTLTGSATLMVLAGGSGGVIAPSRQTARGTGSSDQPLALVPVPPGSAVVGSPSDLRCWTGEGGGLVVEALGALQYLGSKGSTVRLGDYRYTRMEDASGTLYWSVSLEAISPAGARFIRARRGTNDDFPSGEAALLAASGASMPAGLYLISAAWHMRTAPGSASGTVALRAAVTGGGSQSWSEQVDLTSSIGVYPLTVPYQHPGGALTVTLFASMAPGLTGRVTAGTQVTAMWVGPA
jgi:hypothetical protein